MALPWPIADYRSEYLRPAEMIEFLQQMIDDGYDEEPIWIRAWCGEYITKANTIELHEDDSGEAWFEIS